jgi:hypothetical protein
MGAHRQFCRVDRRQPPREIATLLGIGPVQPNSPLPRQGLPSRLGTLRPRQHGVGRCRFAAPRKLAHHKPRIGAGGRWPEIPRTEHCLLPASSTCELHSGNGQRDGGAIAPEHCPSAVATDRGIRGTGTPSSLGSSFSLMPVGGLRRYRASRHFKQSSHFAAVRSDTRRREPSSVQEALPRLGRPLTGRADSKLELIVTVASCTQQGRGCHDRH